MRRVTEPAEAGPEVAAARPAQVADPDARRVRMGGVVRRQHAQHRAYEARRAPTPPGPVRRLLQDRVPGEVVETLARQLAAVREPAVPRVAERVRVTRLGAGLGRERGGDERALSAPARSTSRPTWGSAPSELLETLDTASILRLPARRTKTHWSASGQPERGASARPATTRRPSKQPAPAKTRWASAVRPRQDERFARTDECEPMRAGRTRASASSNAASRKNRSGRAGERAHGSPVRRRGECACPRSTSSRGRRRPRQERADFGSASERPEARPVVVRDARGPARRRRRATLRDPVARPERPARPRQAARIDVARAVAGDDAEPAAAEVGDAACRCALPAPAREARPLAARASSARSRRARAPRARSRATATTKRPAATRPPRGSGRAAGASRRRRTIQAPA